ncbi:MAG TPA: hypothetical protein VEZ88_13240 [Steroidobacteraceae bacterium]|nr:hypothetical protein [Steroidobacteraceae bacterium]
MTGMHTRTDFNSDARYWLSGSILGASVLEPLHELNRAWLALLAVAPRHWAVSKTGSRLPDPVCSGLITLSVEQRAEVARCPFSLFTARFSDDAYWLGAARNLQIPEAPREDGQADRGLAEFTLLALFFTWHLARTNPSSAKIVLGMSDQTIKVFAELPLTILQHLKDGQLGIVCARWPERSWYWLRLLASSERKEEVDEVRTLGLQMLAAELASVSPRGPATPLASRDP